ncbi:hypothetical protein EXIGLDRAFT_721247, partial [Exidia glandulosa HHB12029]
CLRNNVLSAAQARRDFLLRRVHCSFRFQLSKTPETHDRSCLSNQDVGLEFHPARRAELLAEGLTRKSPWGPSGAKGIAHSSLRPTSRLYSE